MILFMSVKLCWTVSTYHWSQMQPNMDVFGDGLGPDTYPIEAKRGVGQIALGHRIMIELGDTTWMFRAG
ncbi:hypothetical protein HZ326_17667 [Fusarium oxysporum f. sp. albedinis]|nr:hypothetical protein HZ326_17667 [Fusarium oxysporum f. sp. albedinis]